MRIIAPEGYNRSRNDTESRIVELFKNGNLAKNGYGGSEGDQFLDIKWTALTDNLPVITNINL